MGHLLYIEDVPLPRRTKSTAVEFSDQSMFGLDFGPPEVVVFTSCSRRVHGCTKKYTRERFTKALIVEMDANLLYHPLLWRISSLNRLMPTRDAQDSAHLLAWPWCQPSVKAK